ncbi:bifunctional protein-serine/threonine kinase/phosphatase [Halomonas sp. McH1-25]|uniref:bifunctional protein-serine/threonine kinase/phosphatase n=1 Tax=unclassified Halomonas TaxID=2609666 RepID=UPI001EF4380F|nr:MULTISPECIES: bifunctional protein-serine/threonine kinase/phosphatase [unclassified Halomonas]MCG7598467.1 bifunctional protein-serine/threonine kinase/phosphatase [Halomonas sp. McH1-25]MCP1343452.1 bifunctional protein-serine/threonine kinase/phosphatase [Halomonas sp. FL8]MCP1361366.1 bifunctional protein-serine/threonine kinase/phosphatase [Halomonas sp. BBD45]MCP1364005.1 bifunctional protein-serine/threonine kinase/phosphatase [Halomonas sp. BBD48]
MTTYLDIAVGQFTDKGRKEINQDFHGLCIPHDIQLTTKGIAVAIADGIGSSDVSHIASQAAIAGFLADYYCTSDGWSVKTAAQRVLSAINSWLHAQTQQSQYRDDKNRGYVCTLSAMVFKAATAHLFHVGDARVYRLRNDTLEQLTQDHRIWVSQHQSHLTRALGIHPHLEMDYQALAVEIGDVFLFLTDGIYEHVSLRQMRETLSQHDTDLDNAARQLAEDAYAQGSHDNLTAQIVRVDNLPPHDSQSFYQHLLELPLPPVLEPRMRFDGYRILRTLHASHRSHVYLASEENASEAPVVLKTPSIEMHGDSAHLERFLLEEWIARRIDNPHVLKLHSPTRQRGYLYTVSEYVEGRTLRQWMFDNPQPDLETVRSIVEQIARGLQAFHRLEMLHQDLRPDNVLIDTSGVVKIIDFGSAHVAGIEESVCTEQTTHPPGTLQYMAPEYFLGARGTARSDIFSLGVITYQMLAGTLPYGTQVAKSRTLAAQRKLDYAPIFDGHREVPVWIDDVLRKAVHPDPHRRYGELSEFIHELRHASKALLGKHRPPLMERNPVLFWKGLSLLLTVLAAFLAWRLYDA